MVQVWLYTLRSSNDPDRVNCVVPWRVDDDFIYFGPCKVRIRERLRRAYLSEGCHFTEVHDDLYLVGMNGSNGDRIRKVVWAGKLRQTMTFAEADRRLVGSRFRDLRNAEYSPLHVKPIEDDDGSLVGYRHRSEEHIEENAWVSDLTSRFDHVRVEARAMTLRGRTRASDVFDRDCCMLLENRFFASGQGIDIDCQALQILREAQPSKCDIDRYAVFGLARNGTANGLRGTFLRINGKLADRFVTWLDDRAGDIAPRKSSDQQTKACDRRRVRAVAIRTAKGRASPSRCR